MERMDEGALKALYETYLKILKINISEDTFDIIKVEDSELTEERGYSRNKISEWLIYFADCEQIHPEDLIEFRKYTDLDAMRSYFADGGDRLSIRYRRLDEDGAYNWVMMELLKSKEYTDEQQILYLYIKAINDNFVAEIETYYELRHSCNYDTLTNVQNSYAYAKANKIYERVSEKTPVGVVYGDVNGLKIVNDTRGHDAGNSLILEFCGMLRRYFGAGNVYRLSGDEFVVILLNVDQEDLESSFDFLYEEIQQNRMPIGAVGWAWENCPETISEVALVAEKRMYKDKAKFYKQNPEFQRDVFEKNYLIEQNAVINFLAEAYSTVGVIDVNTDTYTLIKTAPAVAAAAEGRSYSEYIDIFLSRLVAQESVATIAPLCGVENLKKALKDQEVATVRFVMKDGEHREITFRRMSADEHQQVLRILFYANTVNEYMLKNAGV